MKKSSRNSINMLPFKSSLFPSRYCYEIKKFLLYQPSQQLDLSFDRLHDYIRVVCNLQRPKSGCYEVFEDAAAAKSSFASEYTFERLIGMIPAEMVSTAYARVEERVAEMSKFVDQRLAYQTLWDTQVPDVAAVVGNDIEKWQQLLVESAEARSAVDLSSVSTDFGAVSVN